MRKLHLSSGIWKYKVGVSYTVIRHNEYKTHLAPNYLLVGASFECWDEHGGKVRPGHIRAYIEEIILRENESFDEFQRRQSSRKQ